jgi:hypothetical protein
VRTWPPQDQEELAEAAREIEGRRKGIYATNEDERAAIGEAQQSRFALEDEIREFWKTRGVK